LLRTVPKIEGHGPLVMRTTDCAHLLHTYRQLQAETETLVPPRKALNLRAIPAVAPYLGIFEVRAAGEIIVRLVGTGFVLRTGIDNTGQNALDVLPPNMRAWTSAHFHKMIEVPCGSLCVSREAYGGAHMLTEVISLPFAGASGNVNLVVSASIPFERPDYYTPHEDMRLGEFYDVVYFDIGAGTGE
jgi:hypothetical protein